MPPGGRSPVHFRGSAAEIDKRLTAGGALATQAGARGRGILRWWLRLEDVEGVGRRYYCYVG